MYSKHSHSYKFLPLYAMNFPSILPFQVLLLTENTSLVCKAPIYLHSPGYTGRAAAACKP